MPTTTPGDTDRTRRRLLVDLTPLRESPQFRRTFTGLALANVGQQLATVTIGLQVYAITGSTLAVGLVGVCGLLPLVLLGLYGGSISDAHDRRRVLLLGSLALWTVSLLTALQAWLGLGQVLLLYGLVAAQAAAYAVTSPTRQAIIPRLLPPHLLTAANALVATAFTLGFAVGPLLAGLLVARSGFAVAYTVDAATYLVALWAVARLPPLPPDGAAGRAGLRSVVEGLRFLGTRPVVRMTFLVDLAAMVLAQPRVLLPAVGAVVLGGGPATAGALLTAAGAGAVAAGVLSGPLGAVRRQGVAVIAAICVWGSAVAGFGLVVAAAGRADPGGGVSPLVWPAAGFLVLAGAADAVSSVFRSTILQAATPDALRGRLQGVFLVVVAGGPRLGDVVVGGLGDGIGLGAAAVAGGLACIVVVLALTAWQRGLARYDALHPTP